MLNRGHDNLNFKVDHENSHTKKCTVISDCMQLRIGFESYEIVKQFRENLLLDVRLSPILYKVEMMRWFP